MVNFSHITPCECHKDILTDNILTDHKPVTDLSHALEEQIDFRIDLTVKGQWLGFHDVHFTVFPLFSI